MGKLEREGKDERLVRGDYIRVGSRGRVFGVNGVPLRSTRESEDDDSGKNGHEMTARNFQMHVEISQVSHDVAVIVVIYFFS